MKKIVLYLLLLLPFGALGQLFPEVPPRRGAVKQITEIELGKEVGTKKSKEPKFKSKVNSGWKYTYQYNQNATLAKKTIAFQGKINATYEYKYDTIDNRLVVRETYTATDTNGPGSSVTEFENFLDENKLLSKVNYWSFSSSDQKWQIFQAEQNARYENGQLVSFSRFQVDDKGDFSGSEDFAILHARSGEITQIERTSLVSGFRTLMKYQYNNRGSIEKSSTDFLADLQEYKKTQIQEVRYKCDRQGNWTKKYLKSGDDWMLSSRRKIKYF